MGVKHKFRNEGNTYQLTILNPKLEDSANYTIDIGGVTSTAKCKYEKQSMLWAMNFMFAKFLCFSFVFSDC